MLRFHTRLVFSHYSSTSKLFIRAMHWPYSDKFFITLYNQIHPSSIHIPHQIRRKETISFYSSFISSEDGRYRQTVSRNCHLSRWSLQNNLITNFPSSSPSFQYENVTLILLLLLKRLKKLSFIQKETMKTWILCEHHFKCFN